MRQLEETLLIVGVFSGWTVLRATAKESLPSTLSLKANKFLRQLMLNLLTVRDSYALANMTQQKKYNMIKYFPNVMLKGEIYDEK